MNKKGILLGTLTIAVISIVIGYFQYNKPHTNYQKAKVELVVQAHDLLNAFNTNETLANEKYLDKVIEVSGQPVEIQTNPNGSATIALLDEMNGISCTFDSNYVASRRELFANAKNVRTLNIKGRCDGFLTDVRLSKCSFTNIH